LGNVDAGGTVTFKLYKIEKYLMEKYFITVFWKALEVCYKNIQ